MRRVIHINKALGVVCALAALTPVAAAIASSPPPRVGTRSGRFGAGPALTIHGTSASTLYPGVATRISFTVDNTASEDQRLGTIHLAAVKACTGAGSSWNGTACSNNGTRQTSCESVETGTADTDTANFWMPDVLANEDFPNGSGQRAAASGTLKMNDLSSNQDACQRANLTLDFTS